jgi:glycosyltransferase involved in cell wall biosynthesis
MTVLWMCNLDLRRPNGANLRFINFARGLKALGHTVHFLIPDWTYNEFTAGRSLEDIGAGCTCFPVYRPSGLRSAISSVALIPGWRHRLLRSERRPAVERLRKIVRDLNTDVLITSERMHFFAFEEGLMDEVAVVADLVDSLPLQSVRSMRHAAASGDIRRVRDNVTLLYRALTQEVYAARRASASIYASPVDAAVARRLGGRRVHVLYNGVEVPRASHEDKIPGRIVFPGVMSFGPNLDGALWFIDKVLPAVRARRADAVFVALGADPAPQLQARAGEGVVVTGRVPNLLEELSRATVAAMPLVTGSGFKNKVVEAMAAGTYVVGTRLGSEFLPDDLKNCMTTVDGPSALADAIVSVLDNPAAYRGSTLQARSILADRLFSRIGSTGERRAVRSKKS